MPVKTKKPVKKKVATKKVVKKKVAKKEEEAPTCPYIKRGMLDGKLVTEYRIDNEQNQYIITLEDGSTTCKSL